MKLVLIGSFAPGRPAPVFARFYKSRNIEVYCISADIIYSKNITELCDLVIAREIARIYNDFDIILDFTQQMNYFDISLFIPHDACAIIHIQNDYMLDYKHIRIPVLYWYTEVLEPQIPKNVANLFVMGAFDGALDVLTDAHPVELLQATRLNRVHYIYHGYDANLFQKRNFEKTKLKKLLLFRGFWGSLNQNDHHSKNFMRKCIYHSRTLVLDYLRKTSFEVKQLQPLPDYIQFLHSQLVCLNICGDYAHLNERIFEITGSGCFLLQYLPKEQFETKSFYEQLGFVENESIYYISNMENLQFILDQFMQLDETILTAKLSSIQDYVSMNHSFESRAHQFLNYIKEKCMENL